MLMKVLICGEGVTDVGGVNFESGEWHEGPAIEFVKNASPVELFIEGIRFKQLLKLQPMQKIKSKGHGTKAERLARYAEKKGYDVAICYIDCDSKDNNVFKDKYKLVSEGFAVSNTNVKGIPMIPKAMIENWILADEKAFTKVIGKVPANPKLPAHPEVIWGEKHDPSSNHPKRYLQRVLHQFYKLPDDCLTEIAKQSEPQTMKKQCPISYSPFFDELQKIIDIE